MAGPCKFKFPCALIKDLYAQADSLIGTQQTVYGHVRSVRPQAGQTFLAVYDGSHIKALQGILPAGSPVIHTGAFVKITGTLVKSPAKGQAVEMLITELECPGPVADTTTYLPLVKAVPLELLRGRNAYLRPKFQTYAAVYAIRDGADRIINEHLRGLHFRRLDPNVLSASDCEGAGEMFQLEKSAAFFGKTVGLTVSSQLQLEALVPCAVGVYTLNKSFRAEKSSTSRHLAEFTHLEWESKFVTDLDGLMDFNEDLIQGVIRRVLAEYPEEYALLNQYVSKGIIARLNSFIAQDFARISYTEAVDLIARDREKILALFPDLTPADIPRWGDDLGSRCERYLAEELYARPVFVFNYPRDLKSFYMKVNPVDPVDPVDAQGRYTVQGCDLLVPYMGELIGSSVREEKVDLLLGEILRRGIDQASLDWYVDLRRNGGCKTSGSGMGFDRLVQILCYTNSNIRDAVPFPVAYSECEF